MILPTATEGYRLVERLKIEHSDSLALHSSKVRILRIDTRSALKIVSKAPQA